MREVDSGDMGIRCWKFTDGETVFGQASQRFAGNYCSSGMIFKGLESTLRDMEVDVAMEVARELGSTERMNSQANGSGSWIWERKSENEKSRKLF